MGTHWVVQAVNETQIMMENISFLILIIRTHPVCKAFSYNLSAFTLVIVLIFISKERLSRFFTDTTSKVFLSWYFYDQKSRQYRDQICDYLSLLLFKARMLKAANCYTIGLFVPIFIQLTLLRYEILAFRLLCFCCAVVWNDGVWHINYRQFVKYNFYYRLFYV